jgi:hypothetical protein
MNCNTVILSYTSKLRSGACTAASGVFPVACMALIARKRNIKLESGSLQNARRALQSLLLYFSGLGLVKDSKVHVMGTDGDLINIESFFSGAIDTTSKTKGNSIITLLDGSFSCTDSQASFPFTYICSPSPDNLQPVVTQSSNGNLVLCALGSTITTAPSSIEAISSVQEVKEMERRVHSSFRKALSMSHRTEPSENSSVSGSLTARHFNPNLDLFCSLLDRMESATLEDRVVTMEADSNIVKAAIASRIKEVVSTKASLAQHFKAPICGALLSS